ncbi:MAG: hypothetical protein IKN26_03920, partial [Eubacterium sp.]|nr:hypothetical protein [Eubacterium sp.]
PEVRYEFSEKIAKPNSDIRFDMSEWCELPNKSHTKNFKGALITARIISQDMNFTRSESWTSWVAVNGIAIKEDGFDYSDALMSASPDFSKWYINERYYALAHFSKYVPVGSSVLDLGLRPTEESNDFNISAFETPEKETVLVIVNEGDSREVEIEGNFSDMRVIESNQQTKLSETYCGEFKKTVNCPENSIITVIIG